MPTTSTRANAAVHIHTRAAHDDARSESANATAPKRVATMTVWPEGNEKAGAWIRLPGGAGRPTRLPTMRCRSSPPATDASTEAPVAEPDLRCVAPGEGQHPGALAEPPEPCPKGLLAGGDASGDHDDPDRHEDQDRQQQARPRDDVLDLAPGIARQKAEEGEAP